MKRSVFVAGLLVASPCRAQTTIVADVRAAIAKNDLKGADQLLAKFRQAQGTTPEALEALSWLGRGALAGGDNEARRPLRTGHASARRRDAAQRLARTPMRICRRRSVRRLKPKARRWSRPGSARAACCFSRQQLDRYRATPIRGRIQKNINLLSLEGQPAPPLTANEHLGAPMPEPEGPSGHPVLLGALVLRLQGRGARSSRRSRARIAIAACSSSVRPALRVRGGRRGCDASRGARAHREGAAAVLRDDQEHGGAGEQ